MAVFNASAESDAPPERHMGVYTFSSTSPHFRRADVCRRAGGRHHRRLDSRQRRANYDPATQHDPVTGYPDVAGRAFYSRRADTGWRTSPRRSPERLPPHFESVWWPNPFSSICRAGWTMGLTCRRKVTETISAEPATATRADRSRLPMPGSPPAYSA